MKLNAYCIFDTAAGTYQRPFFMKSDQEAIRTFGDLAKMDDHPVGQHPEDYSLFRVGVFDDNNAKFQLEDRECLVHALETLGQGPKDGDKH